jgi:hypothetical protein
MITELKCRIPLPISASLREPVDGSRASLLRNGNLARG